MSDIAGELNLKVKSIEEKLKANGELSEEDLKNLFILSVLKEGNGNGK